MYVYIYLCEGDHLCGDWTISGLGPHLFTVHGSQNPNPCLHCKCLTQFFSFFFFFFSLFLKQGLYVAQASLRNTSQPLFLQVPGYWDCPIQIPYIDKKVWTKLSKLTCKWTEKVVLNICQFYQDSKQTGCLGADLKNLKWEYHHPVLLSLKRRGGDCHSGFFQMQC